MQWPAKQCCAVILAISLCRRADTFDSHHIGCLQDYGLTNRATAQTSKILSYSSPPVERPASVARVSFWAAAFVQARASFGMPACPLISLLTPALLSNPRGKPPHERKQRIAIVMSGKLGSVQGSLRTSHDSGVDPTVFRVAAHCWKRHVAFDDNVLTFVHSWDVEANTTVMNELRPVRALFEKQRSFEDYPNNHGWSSQWFSRRRALELVRQYEKESRRPFDWVYLTRFDSCHCAKLGTRTPAIPINLDHHRMPANIQLNAAFMGAFIETRDGNKLVHPNRSAFGNTGSAGLHL